jgi:hypothetical protein
MGEPIAELGGRKWAELEVLEHANGQLMFPAELRRRTPSGEVRTVKVRFRVPSPDDIWKARVEARDVCEKRKIDETKDKDLFDQVEQLVLLSFAIRADEHQHPQFAKFDDLSAYDEGCLLDIQEQINRRKAELDPRDSITTEEQFWRACIATVKEMDTGPLADIAGRDQNAFVVRMALEACRSPTGLSWLRSLGISIPESSQSPSSVES